jgi:hypothetical protein
MQSTALAESGWHALFHCLSGMPWFGWIAIVAIVSGTLSSALQARIRHAERMEMIRMGMNPDGGPKQPQAEV